MVLDINQLIKKLEGERKGMVLVFTNGCFDIIHAGHCHYLEEARRLGDILVVGLNSDESVKRIKGKGRPIIPQEQRAKVLSSLQPVDYVVIFNEDTPFELIRSIKPDVLVKGGDWSPENIVGKDFVESYGGKVVTIPFRYDVSTTSIVEKIIKTYCS